MLIAADTIMSLGQMGGRNNHDGKTYNRRRYRLWRYRGAEAKQ
jgi:hypothetical protein